MRIQLLRMLTVAGLSMIALSTSAHALDMPVLGASPMLSALSASTEDLLFTGETAKKTLVMVAQPEQLAGTSSLYITLQSAVSVAPEWSKVIVSVNDVELGTAQLKSGAPYAMQFPLPAGLLQPGYNAVTFTVDQAHRVDCSIDATYELWTRIDPLASGFAFDGARASAPDFSSILAAVRTQNGMTSIHGLTDVAEGTQINRLLAAVQTLAIGAAIDRPNVDFSPLMGSGPGIDLLIGSRLDVQNRLGAVSSQMSLVDGVNIGRRADGRTVIALLGASDDEFARALQMLKEGLAQAAIGTPAGLAALDALKGPELPANGKLTFARLGVDNRDFAGRLFDQSVYFRLPSDFYPADYAQAQISLDALYAPGLANGASLQFKVNDEIVSTLKLSGSRVAEAKSRRLPIPLSAFRPGLNKLEIEAQLPAQLDAACAPGATADNGRRLKLGEGSTVQLPTLARIGRFPDLAAIDYSLVGRNPSTHLNVVTPKGDATELQVAASMLARVAFSSGRVVDVDLSTTPSLDDDTPVLLVGAIRDLPDDFALRLPFDFNASPIARPDAPFDDAAIPVEPSLFPALPTVEIVTGEAKLAIDDLKATLYGLGLTAGVKIDVLQDEAATAIAPMVGTDLIVAQTANSFGLAPVTIITAQTTEQLSNALPQLTSRSGWSQLKGSGVSLTANGERLQAIGARSVQYYPGGDSSLGNARLIAAGWLSNTPIFYSLLVLFAAIILGVLTQILLARTRVRRSR